MAGMLKWSPKFKKVVFITNSRKLNLKQKLMEVNITYEFPNSEIIKEKTFSKKICSVHKVKM
jgi:hypothetical protein